MGVFSILIDSIGLAIGSLLAAGLLSYAAWWLADRSHRSWVASAFLLALCAGMLFSPLERSLFVRMTTVFSFVAAALLYFIVPDAADGQADGAEQRVQRQGHQP